MQINCYQSCYKSSALYKGNRIDKSEREQNAMWWQTIQTFVNGTICEFVFKRIIFERKIYVTASWTAFNQHSILIKWNVSKCEFRLWTIDWKIEKKNPIMNKSV